MEEIFILIGRDPIDNRESDYILGIYNTLECALKDIENYEQDRQNYACLKCDYGLNDEEITEDQFKTKICPECRNILEYCPSSYDAFDVEKFLINQGERYYKKDQAGYDSGFDTGQTIYTNRFNHKKKTIQQWFLPGIIIPGYKKIRTVNEPILIDF